MTKDILKSAAHCIAVNLEIKRKLVSLGAMPEKVSIVSPYLPPVIKEEEIAAVPPEVWTFMANHTPLISANAFAIIRDKGEDLYGIDMCIELCAALKSIYPGVGLVFALPSIRDYEYFNELKRRISDKGIEDNFLFQTRPCQLYPVLMKSDIFVRPTTVDSYGVSIAESICFRVPAVASDVCMRPEGTVLFKSQDTADFIARVKSVWENYGYYKSKLESLQVTSPLDDILKIYRQVAREESSVS
jgi:glycosyltransferase involved in cell wall biosynthesis